jgi:hypothetical protein
MRDTSRKPRSRAGEALGFGRDGAEGVARPPALISGLRKMLVASGVDEDDIRNDEFSGY